MLITFISNIIFQLIDGGLKVLDVGCGTGRLGEKLRLEKNCYVVGVEEDYQAVSLAKSRLDDVVVADVERLSTLPYPKKYFDVTVFADVLEHLKRPEKALTFFKEYLKDDGYIIASIPNVANWTLRLKLLLGKWNYKERGLLDKTHLRFFTLKTTKELIEGADFKITYLTCTSGWSWVDWKMPFHNPANVWKSLLACNFIIKATKSKGTNRGLDHQNGH
jgi:methionine biosynthesis protein MetW